MAQNKHILKNHFLLSSCVLISKDYKANYVVRVNPKVGMQSFFANPQFLGLIPLSQDHKFLRCACPQIANSQFFMARPRVANWRISLVFHSANNKKANFSPQGSEDSLFKSSIPFLTISRQNQIKNKATGLFREIFFIKYESEHFKPLFVREKNYVLLFFGCFGSAKNLQIGKKIGSTNSPSHLRQVCKSNK